MNSYNIKHEVSDPAFYDPLISEQKKHLRQNPDDTGEMVELGRLFEARIDMIKYFAGRQFVIRYFVPIYILLISGLIWFLHILNSGIAALPSLWKFFCQIFILAITGVIFSRLWLIRYPPSGSKYFKKAIALDPECADAYMYLGLIALRRHQKKKACYYLERAVQLDANNKSRIEQELKSVYEKEFVSFFKKRPEKEIRQQEIIDHQLDQIRMLRQKNAGLEKRVESLSAKMGQAKWETGHKTKLVVKEMKDNISTIRRDYEKQIAELKQEAKEEAKVLAGRDFVRLTTEIMEAKAGMERQSLASASRAIENTIGKHIWEKLSERCRTYLATAEHVYTLLTEQEEKTDYSLVGMELCKALETEINKRLVEPFVMYLNGNESEFLKINQTGEKKDRPSYFTYLAMVVDRANYPEVKTLTLGQYHFILKRTLEDDYALSEYSDFLDRLYASSETVIGKAFLKKLETVVKKYRNTIAHESPMNKKQYDHLRKLVFSGKEALLKI